MDKLNHRFPRYSRLLALYPAGYRKEYSKQMLQILADMLDDPARNKTATWIRTALDFPVSVTKQQLTYTGETMKGTPYYLKQNAMTGVWLVTPFFLFIIIDSLFGKRLEKSVIWHTNVLFAWLVVFPAIAILLNLAALLCWLQSQRRETGKGIWTIMTASRQSWPAISVAVIGFAILVIVFGHDSVHCIGGNPFYELSHRHQTLQCLEQR